MTQADRRWNHPLPDGQGQGGGIYRPASLITTDAVCISPLDSASSGVYLTIKQLAAESAAIEVRTVVSNGLTTAANAQAVPTTKPRWRPPCNWYRP